ncbi:ribonuclease pancreatic-like [Crotalus tigris]|uniref:ribonuclease pancreatic-like n=1 Tax=Crotalus tigris TaxID=88082 RepID=UPI00192F54F3|nr:ribonuclease pancreatic-like [Crotalus tigris]
MCQRITQNVHLFSASDLCRFLESPIMLASKISCLLVVSLTFLLGTLLVLPSQGQTWAAFKNKHIDSNSQYPPLNPNLYCENQMRFRHMTNPRCKPHNTFINAPDYLVQQICQNIRSPTPITSRFSFNLVDCNHTGGSPLYRCNYRGIPQTKHVRVTCDNYVPVHFVRII